MQIPATLHPATQAQLQGYVVYAETTLQDLDEQQTFTIALMALERLPQGARWAIMQHLIDSFAEGKPNA